MMDEEGRGERGEGGEGVEDETMTLERLVESWGYDLRARLPVHDRYLKEDSRSNSDNNNRSNNSNHRNSGGNSGGDSDGDAGDVCDVGDTGDTGVWVGAWPREVVSTVVRDTYGNTGHGGVKRKTLFGHLGL